MSNCPIVDCGVNGVVYIAKQKHYSLQLLNFLTGKCASLPIQHPPDHHSTPDAGDFSKPWTYWTSSNYLLYSSVESIKKKDGHDSTASPVMA